MTRFRFLFAAGLPLFLLLGCSSLYYSAMEKVGYPKRDIFVTRVKSAKESQTEAKHQFRSALEQFRTTLGTPGGNMEKKYEVVKTSLDRSEARATEVKKRIKQVEDVSDALFEEWEDELETYHNDSLRRQSANRLSDTKAQYKVLISSMKRAESKLEPVLVPLRDNVLFLKHNLNARAIGTLHNELHNIEESVSRLIADLDRSIEESEQFIEELARSS